MLKHLTLAAVLMASSAPLAHAQEGPDYDQDRYERPDRAGPADGPRADMNDRDKGDRHDDRRMRDMRHGDRWARNDEDRMDRMRDEGPGERMGPGDRPGPRGPHGPDGRRGPPPPPPAPRTGFEIRMGPGQMIRVDCGDEMFADCVDAAQPILDAMKAMPPEPRPGDAAGPAGDRVPPPPRGLVDTPSANGDTPPPPPSPDEGPDAGDTTPPAAN